MGRRLRNRHVDRDDGRLILSQRIVQTNILQSVRLSKRNN